MLGKAKFSCRSTSEYCLEIHIFSFSILGVVPVTIRPPHPQNITTTLPTVKMVVEVSKANAVLTVTSVVRMLKSKVYISNYVFSADSEFIQLHSV